MGLMDKIKNILVIPDEDELENEVEETVEKPEAKKTDEYGISVPEKTESKTQNKEQGRGR